jgi:hypothetical protein
MIDKMIPARFHLVGIQKGHRDADRRNEFNGRGGDCAYATFICALTIAALKVAKRRISASPRQKTRPLTADRFSVNRR